MQEYRENENLLIQNKRRNANFNLTHSRSYRINIEGWTRFKINYTRNPFDQRNPLEISGSIQSVISFYY